MMEFIIMTLSFTVAIMLASVLGLAITLKIMLNSKVLGWCMKKVNKIANQIINESFDSDEEL